MTGDELRAWHLSLGMSQVALARALGIGKDTLSRWERGTPTGHPNLLRLALVGLAYEQSSMTIVWRSSLHPRQCIVRRVWSDGVAGVGPVLLPQPPDEEYGTLNSPSLDQMLSELGEQLYAKQCKEDQ